MSENVSKNNNNMNNLSNVNVSILTDKDAKIYISTFIKLSITKGMHFGFSFYKTINKWYKSDEKQIILCLVYTLNNVDVSFCLLSTSDFHRVKDIIWNIPPVKHINGYIVDYIYTLPEYRRKGYASVILKNIKMNNYKITCFSNDQITHSLFKNCDYCYSGTLTMDEDLYNVYRYP